METFSKQKDRKAREPRNVCAYPECRNTRHSKPNLTMFRFPKDRFRQIEWLKSIGKTLEDFEPPITKRLICSEHFKNEYLTFSKKKLVEYACPTPYDSVGLSSTMVEKVTYFEENPSNMENPLQTMEFDEETITPDPDNHYFADGQDYPLEVNLEVDDTPCTTGNFPSNGNLKELIENIRLALINIIGIEKTKDFSEIRRRTKVAIRALNKSWIMLEPSIHQETSQNHNGEPMDSPDEKQQDNADSPLIIELESDDDVPAESPDPVLAESPDCVPAESPDCVPAESPDSVPAESPDSGPVIEDVIYFIDIPSEPEANVPKERPVRDFLKKKKVPNILRRKQAIVPRQDPNILKIRRIETAKSLHFPIPSPKTLTTPHFPILKGKEIMNKNNETCLGCGIKNGLLYQNCCILCSAFLETCQKDEPCEHPDPENDLKCQFCRYRRIFALLGTSNHSIPHTPISSVEFC